MCVFVFHGDALVPPPLTALLFLAASEMSTDESEREDEEGDQNEEERLSCRGSLRKTPPETPQSSERWESAAATAAAAAPDGSKPPPPPVSGKNHEPPTVESADVGKRRPDVEGEVSSRKRKSDERPTKGQSKAKTRNTRSADWLPAGSPRKLDGGERAPEESSSSEDEAAAKSQAGESERSRPKSKGSPSKKYNGMKEKSKAGRQAGFWEIPEKRAKTAAPTEERPAVRAKGQKDVWSSIQAQWPKKTLKELFSDSDTEANSPPPPVPSCLDDQGVEQDGGVEDEASEEQMENDKLQEFPSSGSNSVLNTPPTTPESPSGGGSAVEDAGQPQPSSSPPQSSLPVALPPEPLSDALPPGAPQEEAAGGRSETDSSTVEVESLGGELQDLPQDEAAGSPSKGFDVSLSCNSSSSCSLELSSSSQQDSEQKSKGTKHNKINKLQGSTTYGNDLIKFFFFQLHSGFQCYVKQTQAKNYSVEILDQ